MIMNTYVHSCLNELPWIYYLPGTKAIDRRNNGNDVALGNEIIGNF